MRRQFSEYMTAVMAGGAASTQALWTLTITNDGKRNEKEASRRRAERRSPEHAHILVQLDNKQLYYGVRPILNKDL